MLMIWEKKHKERKSQIKDPDPRILKKNELKKVDEKLGYTVDSKLSARFVKSQPKEEASTKTNPETTFSTQNLIYAARGHFQRRPRMKLAHELFQVSDKVPKPKEPLKSKSDQPKGDRKPAEIKRKPEAYTTQNIIVNPQPKIMRVARVERQLPAHIAAEQASQPTITEPVAHLNNEKKHSANQKPVIEKVKPILEPEVQYEPVHAKGVPSLPAFEIAEVEFARQELADEIGFQVPEIDDDAWIDNLLAKYNVEVRDEQVETITLSVKENMELDDEQTEHVAAVVYAMPETVQVSLASFTEQAEPERLEPVQELVIEIAGLADQLHQMAIVEELGTIEAKEIEQILTERFEELLSHLGVEVDDKIRTEFIKAIVAPTYRAVVQKEANELFDESMRERKTKRRFDLSAMTTTFGKLTHGMEMELARLVVRQSAAVG